MKTYVTALLGLGMCLARVIADPVESDGESKARVSPTAVETASEVPAALRALEKAAAFRAELTHRVLAGLDKPETVVERLRAQPNPAGLGLDRGTEVGLAAIDIGHRLVAAGRSSEAEFFFKEAEASLAGALAANVGREKEKERVAILEKRGQVRADYLGDLEGAKADFEEAVRLMPDDRRLQALRDHVLKPRAQRKLGERNN